MEDTRLGAILLEGGIVGEADLERCLSIQALTGGTRPIGQILVEQDLIGQATLQRLLDLQKCRNELRAATVGAVDTGPVSLLQAARGNGAAELVVSEGRPVRLRVAGSWRQLTEDPVRGPEVWDFVRELMGAEVLEELAERHFVIRSWQRPELGRGSATAFRQFEGVAVRVVLAPVTTTAETALPQAVLDQTRTGRGLVLVGGERGIGRLELLTPLLHAAARSGGDYVVAVDDEPIDLPAQGAMVVRRRYGIDTEDRAAALRAAIGEDPDTLVVGDVGAPATFELALRAAEGGRLVVAWIDANNVTAMLQRILNFYPTYDLPRVRSSLAAVLRAVFVRHELPDAGHDGTVAATELLLVDDAVRDVLRGGELADLGLLLRMEGSRCGHSLDRSLLDLLTGGRVRLEDVFARAEEKAWLLERTRDLQPTAE
jgi:twitching motility protein PilT